MNKIQVFTEIKNQVMLTSYNFYHPPQKINHLPQITQHIDENSDFLHDIITSTKNVCKMRRKTN